MRYKLDELLNQITTRLPTNTTGAVTAQVLRDLLTDFVWSFRGATAYLSRAAAGMAVPLTAVFQVPAALFDTAYSVDNSENEAAVGTQNIVAKVTGSYEVTISATIEGAVNEEVIVAVMQTGVANTLFQQRVQLLGAGKPNTIDIQALLTGVPALASIQFGIRAETGTPSVTIGPVALISRLIPTRT